MDTSNDSASSAAGRPPHEKRSTINNTSSSQPTAAASGLNTSQIRRNDANVVYSQPANTGTGKEIMTQVFFAVDYMKSKGNPLKFEDIASYLSLVQQGHDQRYIRELERILQKHNKVEYDPTGAGGKGTYQFRPPHNVRNADQLLKALQSQNTGHGMSVAELKEGWPNIVQTINKLEEEGKLLVTRNKKEDLPKMVWANDPSLIQEFDPEFKHIWERIRIPESAAVVEELEKAGITPTSKNKVIKPRPKVEQKKTKKARRSGKTTNTHMAGILRDYSHLKP